MTDDLVKRLRELAGRYDEAAERIEELDKRNKELEAALRQFADENNWEEWVGWVGDGEPQDIARAALGEKKDGD